MTKIIKTLLSAALVLAWAPALFAQTGKKADPQTQEMSEEYYQAQKQQYEQNIAENKQGLDNLNNIKAAQEAEKAYAKYEALLTSTNPTFDQLHAAKKKAPRRPSDDVLIKARSEAALAHIAKEYGGDVHFVMVKAKRYDFINSIVDEEASNDYLRIKHTINTGKTSSGMSELAEYFKNLTDTEREEYLKNLTPAAQLFIMHSILDYSFKAAHLEGNIYNFLKKIIEHQPNWGCYSPKFKEEDYLAPTDVGYYFEESTPARGGRVFGLLLDLVVVAPDDGVFKQTPYRQTNNLDTLIQAFANIMYKSDPEGFKEFTGTVFSKYWTKQSARFIYACKALNVPMDDMKKALDKRHEDRKDQYNKYLGESSKKYYEAWVKEYKSLLNIIEGKKWNEPRRNWIQRCADGVCSWFE